jgi:2-polyprenyl-6-methoxyphenol hydroxylase-like FAD-dependent oxidoreductase
MWFDGCVPALMKTSPQINDHCGVISRSAKHGRRLAIRVLALVAREVSRGAARDLDVEESWSAPGDIAVLAAAYDRWDTQVRQGAMDHTFRWGIYDRTPLTTGSTDHITLLADAAHAVTPYLGQGANQSVEDAITLAVPFAFAGGAMRQDDVGAKIVLGSLSRFA